MDLNEEGRSLLALCRERVQAVDRTLRRTVDPVHERIIRKWLVDVAEADFTTDV